MNNDKKLIAESLLQLAKESKTEFIEDAKLDKKIKDAATKIGLQLPNPDIAVFRTVWAKIDSKNLNGVRLTRKVVEEGLKTILFKQINWEHDGAGYVCGTTIDAEIDGDKIITTNILYKSLFPDKFEELKEKVKSGEAAVSFEIWAKHPETKKSLIKVLADGTKEFIQMIIHGTGLLLCNPPAEPNARIFSLVAKKEINELEKIAYKVFSEDLCYASLALEEIEEASYECLKCGKIITSEKHCKDIKCPECGGNIRRKDCPGKGQPTEKSEKEEKKVELVELYFNVTKEEDITFEIAMAFYYSSDEDKAKLTEDAAKWTRKFINDLPDSAFAVIEPAYPEKTEDKSARHLPHHNGEGDLGKEKSNANLDLPHYKNALARVNQIKPVTDSISAEDLQKKANAHLERHKDALEKSSEETKTEVKPEETKAQETVAAETKSVETKVEETKEVKAQEMQIIEPKIIVKVTTEYREIRVSTYVDGTPSGTDEVKGYFKKITEYKDGTKDEVEEETKIEKKYTFAELEEKINTSIEELIAALPKEVTDCVKQKTKDGMKPTDAVKECWKEFKDKQAQAMAEEVGKKDIEITNLKTELDTKNQEIATLKVEKATVEKPEGEKLELDVGAVDVEKTKEDRYKNLHDAVDEKAFGKRKDKK